MKPRIIFIHGNQSTSWAFAWTPWLKQELETRGYRTDFQTFPDSIIARAQYWLPFLKDNIQAGEGDVLVGWSSGAVAAMRYAEKNKVLGSVLVSPSYTNLNDELEKQSGYFDTPWDWESIKANQKHIALVHSENDPFIPTAEFQFIAQALQPTVINIPQGGHFMEQNYFPEVLEYLTQTYP
ncbi:MAG: alpha/beta fold hydrolase [Candidatus Veblenbacteria bacterium]|nr:alpha/beta fold hydrolase [Candidatus Veblenbacteria bacterium]MDZ4229688.1 alpha/beta fold hydrolase [Candidatus Veblenbacteria bacterium]